MIAIIGTLVGLLLPAVQSAREGGRKSACLGNVRELADAVTQMASRNGQFPQPRRVTDFKIAPTNAQGREQTGSGMHASLIIQLLPALGFQELYDGIHAGTMAIGTEQQLARNKNLSILLCPSDLDRFPTTASSHGQNNYRGNIGNLPNPGYFTVNNGIFQDAANNLQRVVPAHVIDGLSQTALFAERRLGDNDDNSIEVGSDWFAVPDTRPAGNPFTTVEPVYTDCTRVVPQAGSANQVSTSGESWYYASAECTTYNHVSLPNGQSCLLQTGTFSFANGSITPPTSRHPGGVAFALCDGATRFVANTIDLTVWRALGSRNGGEIIPDDWR